jgi:hypothetical protein
MVINPKIKKNLMDPASPFRDIQTSEFRTALTPNVPAVSEPV